ncbi:hypothetical protein [Teredinibacter sp. KSP-S5-2]|uniref:hypothetical protein n=1 Tax=Teredinibacter sp. KSP-S5-2 TaxID=3034506 RepID=UPI0029350044|nr:hypothetical protein [Teredinibacter sp. KSP-S5-2]WNO10864.1 hypothetical protein P5V12_06710 [Teredinibacter sp. KSP-S5-2]
MTRVLKVGIDIHGVIDTFPEKFKLLSSALVQAGAEVHIVTGSKRCERIDNMLANAGIQFTHYFSIVDHLEQTSVDVQWRKGLPYADENAWNIAKSQYCEAQDIDLMFDDSEIYKSTFHGIETTFLHVIG